MCHANRGLLASPFELSSSREVEWGSEVGLEPSAIMGPNAFIEGLRPIIPGPRRLRVGTEEVQICYEDYSFATSAPSGDGGP
ncbi:hypothetical protein B296_00030193 [Ensete ventricosum]|uniref:Uncharacterized protein n=1 Tax=Ensete ventricosum TaxID=4639 RepID=A0A427AFM2_ENSVE|nr:hypothetical protein B296_00030193 [Ensete ventricosum]